MLATTPQEKLSSLALAVDRLTSDFGTWQTPWGEINRFQRVNDDIAPGFDDAAPSIPVPFVAGTWGSLASFAAAPRPNTKKWYGVSGNSFVAVVEFGSRVRAVAVTAGGEIRRFGTAPAIFDRSTSIPTNSSDTRSAPTIPVSSVRRPKKILR